MEQEEMVRLLGGYSTGGPAAKGQLVRDWLAYRRSKDDLFEVAQAHVIENHMRDCARYSWWEQRRGAGVCRAIHVAWKALSCHDIDLDLDEEVLDKALDLYTDICNQDIVSVFDLIGFCDNSRKAAGHPMGVALFDVVAAATCSDRVFLVSPQIRCFQAIIRKALNAVERSTVTRGGARVLDIGGGHFVAVPEAYRSSEHNRQLYWGRYGLAWFTGNLKSEPINLYVHGDNGIVKEHPMLTTACLDPFFEPEDVPVHARLLAFLSVTNWTLMCYAALVRMCLTPDLMEWGQATSKAEGQQALRWLQQNGIDLNDPLLFGRFMNVYVRGKRHSLPSPAIYLAGNCPKTALADFLQNYYSFVAEHGHGCMRTRRFAASSTTRRELVNIRAIRDFKRAMVNKILAVGATATITLGQWAITHARV